MPVYEFGCDCGQDSSTVRSMTGETMIKYCPRCGEEMGRRFSSPAFHRFEEHVSPATGKPVTSMKNFKEQLKIASAEATERTGIPHNFVPTEVKPQEGPGTDSQARAHRARGTPGFERKKLYL